MEYIVCRPHVFRGERGEPMPKHPGERVRVDHRRLAKRLLQQGIIKPENTPERRGMASRADSYGHALRIGCFLHTSKHYSGGRLHLYQILWTLANEGAQCFLLTDRAPIWRRDYPPHDNLIIVNTTDKLPPDDIDLILTDGKGGCAAVATQYKKDHPHLPMLVVNFETPNWVAKFVPESAGKMDEVRHNYKAADVMLANSAESLRQLAEYMDLPRLTGVTNPVCNTTAVDQNVEMPCPLDRPYVVWSARGSAYKGAKVIIEAVLSYPGPLDLVMIGNPSHLPGDTKQHRFIKFMQPITDAQKMRLMAGAKCVAAPSKFEGYGMVPAEALCNGTPVVVYDLPVLREEYGERLIYVPWGKDKAFAKKLHETVDNPPAVDKEAARKDYGMDAMARQLRGLPYLNLKRRRVSAQMICYYGPTVQEAIASVYPHVDEVIIAHGPTELWKNVPPDNSLELIQEMPDPDKKIQLIQKDVWENKREMRRACQRKMTGNYLVIVDADEIYHDLDKWIAKAPDYGCPRWVHFWHDSQHYVVDNPGMERWGKPHPLGGGTHNHLRWCYWRYSYEWSSHRGTVAIDKNKSRLCSGFHTKQATEACPECCIYHLGHVLPPDLMTAKHQFYLQRDGRDPGRVQRMKAWHKWKGELGDCGDGCIREVDWELPKLVLDAFDKIEEFKHAKA